MTLFREIIFMSSCLFGKVRTDVDVKCLKMTHFPLKGFKYLSWCGYIIYRDDIYADIDPVNYNHECIHIAQAKDEGSWIMYYLKYVIEWLKGNPLTDSRRSYATNKYEVEAYAKEEDYMYIDNREDGSVDKFVIDDRDKWFVRNGNYWMNEIKRTFGYL